MLDVPSPAASSPSLSTQRPLDPGGGASSVLQVVGTQCLTPDQVRQLAVDNAPVLIMNPGERNGMEDPLRYIKDSSLRKERDFWPDKELAGKGTVDPAQLATIDDSDTFLDHGDSAAERGGNNDRGKLLYEYDADKNTVTYHLFYAYNDGPGPQNHEGDWEAITVKLGDDYKPTDVYYSGHGGATHRSWADAPKQDGRPVSYVALGSHANYPEPGRWATEFPGAYDQVANGSGSEVVDLQSHSAIDVTSQPYYGSGAGWGERGTAKEIGIGDTSGPTGPSPHKLDSILGATDKASDKQPEGSLGFWGGLADKAFRGWNAIENGSREIRHPVADLLDNPSLLTKLPLISNPITAPLTFFL